MYQNNYFSQQDVCLICLKTISRYPTFHLLISHHKICPQCANKFKKLDIKGTFHHYPIRILYAYNDFFRSLLFRYKGQYDIALKDVFLDEFHRELTRYYKDYMIVVVPSSSSDNKRRGFAPNQAIASTIHSHVFNGLYKKTDYKQSEKSYKQRAGVHSIMGLRGGSFLKNKKVLLLDDVMTSGETILTCLELIEKEKPLKIEILLLSIKEKNIDNLGINKQNDSK